MQASLFGTHQLPPLPGEASPKVAHLFDGPILHIGPVERIGKHDWVFVIYHNDGWGRGSYDYAWRKADSDDWHRPRDWPGYDNCRSDNGLPLSVRVLWKRAAPERAHHLGDLT